MALKRAVALRGLGEGNYAVPPADFAAFDAWFKEFLPRMLSVVGPTAK